jgi:hypothetical protein
MKDRQRLDGVQWNQDTNQELLVLGLQGQRKAIDDAFEGAEERSKAQLTRPQSFLPSPELQLRPKENHLPKISSSSATPLKCSNS